VATGPAGASLAGTTTRTVVGGIAAFDDLSLDKAGDYTLAASVGGLAGLASDHFVVTHAATDAFTLALTPDTLVADGTSTAAASVLVTDRFGNPVAGDPVTITTTGDAPVGAVTDNGDGTYSAVVTASHTVGAEDIVAADGDRTASHVLAEHHGPPATLTLSTPAAVTADGTSTTSVVATIADQWGNPVDGEHPTITTSGHSVVGAMTDNGDGTYAATITASTTFGSERLVARDGALSAASTLVEAPIGCPLSAMWRARPPTPSAPRAAARCSSS
jgi:adhesin/invasin